jgi:hypothetical protein
MHALPTRLWYIHCTTQTAPEVLDSIATYWQHFKLLDMSQLDDSSSSNTQHQHKQEHQQQQQLHSTYEPLHPAVKPPDTAAVVMHQSVQDQYKRNLSAKYLLHAVTDLLRRQQQQCGAAVTVAATIAALKSYRLYCVALPAASERAASLAVVDYCTAKLLQCKATLSSSSSDDTVLERWTNSVQQSAELAADKLKEVSQANMLLHYIL